MKILTLIVSVVVLGFSTSAFAQDTAPASLAGKTAVAVISSGGGVFAPIGGYRISFSAGSATYSVTPLSVTVEPGAGTYTYAKTGPNTARLSVTDTAVGAAIAQTLVFTSPTTAAYTISSAFGSQAGTVVFENITTTISAGAGLSNMSVRAVVPVGSQIIPGLVLDSRSRVLLRVAGPTLATFNVPGTLPNPKLTVMSGSTVVATNDDWSSTSSNQAAVQDAANKTGAFGFIVGSRDAALVLDLNAGNYTCVISGDAGTSGEVILEVYRVPQ